MNCPACGVADCKQVYDEVAAYSVSLGDREFVHQLVVDTYAAQHAAASSKPISVVFSVAGLYLVNEHAYTGKKVQQAHMRMARSTRQWPLLGVPSGFASMTVANVLAVSPDERPAAITAWSEAVWRTWADRRDQVDTLVRQHAGWI